MKNDFFDLIRDRSGSDRRETGTGNISAPLTKKANKKANKKAKEKQALPRGKACTDQNILPINTRKSF
jgi:hypothetical protein